MFITFGYCCLYESVPDLYQKKKVVAFLFMACHNEGVKGETPLPLSKMSCPIESDLLRHEEQQDQLHREELERENNPVYYWHIVTKDWSDYAHSRDEADEFIQMAKNEGLVFSCTKHIEGISYQ